MPMQGLIDVHHHLIPPAFTKAMHNRGITKVAGAPLPVWDGARSLALMDATGIKTAILSLSAPGVYFDGRQQAIDLARACNDFAGEMAQANPDRFGFFAVLPMPLCQESCAEAVRALDELGATGIVLLASTEGVFLGDPQLEDLMAELDRRQATIFVHPNIHASSNQVEIDIPGFFIEFLCDTSRATANLIFSGTLERFPSIKWILAHAGGFIPYIAWRLALADTRPDFAERAPKGVLHYLRQLYYDTALSPSPWAIRTLLDLVGPDHILFGSDFPFAPEALIPMEISALRSADCLDESMRNRIFRTNAASVLPRLRAIA